MNFLCYKIPNQKVEIHSGSWEKCLEKNKRGFIISDAHGENFWQFHKTFDSSWDTVSFFELPNCNLTAISEEDYLTHAEKLIEEMREKAVDKVVYSRIKAVTLSSNQFQFIFETLCERYPNNLNYLFSHPELGFWMGSTPEILIQGTQKRFTSMALAGTLPSDAPDLEWTNKEFEEQAYVSEYLNQLINKYGDLISKSARYVVPVGPVKHLRNDFEFSLSGENLWPFISELHPTPAVCGVPKQKAKLLYQSHEAHDRSLYTGIIGLVDEDYCALYVNLRCMQLFKDNAALYVGGGFTIDSDPLKEWLETERKADTLVKILDC